MPNVWYCQGRRILRLDAADSGSSSFAHVCSARSNGYNLASWISWGILSLVSTCFNEATSRLHRWRSQRSPPHPQVHPELSEDERTLVLGGVKNLGEFILDAPFFYELRLSSDKLTHRLSRGSRRSCSSRRRKWRNPATS